MEITLSVNKTNVMTEVARNADYGGAKMTNDENAYGRMTLTDEDGELLERFWDECRAEAVRSLARRVTGEAFEDPVYTLTLNASSLFDTVVQESMRLNLFSYFVQGITAKWYRFTSKKEVGDYIDQAAALLDAVREGAYHKKRPTRPAGADKPQDSLPEIGDITLTRPIDTNQQL